MSITQKADAILAIKGQIKSAIEAKKGGSVTGAFSTYPTEIANLPTGGGMPSIPSSFTSLNLNQSYTAPSDGWIRYTIRYNWGMGQNSYLDVGTRSYSFANVQGEDMDIGSLTMTGIAPVYAGETFKLTAQGSTSASSVLEVAYI